MNPMISRNLMSRRNNRHSSEYLNVRRITPVTTSIRNDSSEKVNVAPDRDQPLIHAECFVHFLERFAAVELYTGQK
jgi:hypothetical protein